MQKLYSKIHAQLLNHHIAGVPKHTGQVHPFYAGFSIANLPASICRWLGCPEPGGILLDEAIHSALNQDYQHIIVLLVDGLSLQLFTRFFQETMDEGRHQEWKPFFEDGMFVPLTSISPSTTSAALTTLWTGVTPVEHGIIGYDLFLKEYGLVANMITHSVTAFVNDPIEIYRAGFDPISSLPIKPISRSLGEQKIRVFVHQHQSIASSGLSRMLLDGAEQVPYHSADELWDTLGHTIARCQNCKSYSFVYWSKLDTLSHLAGPESEQVYQEWLVFSTHLHQWISRMTTHQLPRTLLILSADHGQIATDIRSEYDLQNHPQLIKHLVMLPTGETRMPYLYIKPGAQNAVQEYLASHWEGDFGMRSSQDVLACGLLGNAPAHQTTLDRCGDHVVFPRANAYWWWMNKANHLLGRHGGLSINEMLVPFFALPLGKL